MSSTDTTLRSPARRRGLDDADDRDAAEPQVDVGGAVLRFLFTVAALVGLSALFASQLHATLR